MDRIQLAECLARIVHSGQVRNGEGGEEYIEHCRRVAYIVEHRHIIFPDIVTNDDMICAAWLHDCVENSNNPNLIAKMIKEYFNNEIWKMVSLLTHMKNMCTYNTYIYVIMSSKNEGAIRVKWADMIDNTTDVIPEKQFNKYRNACKFLQAKRIVVPDILIKRLKLYKSSNY